MCHLHGRFLRQGLYRANFYPGMGHLRGCARVGVDRPVARFRRYALRQSLVLHISILH